MIAIINPVNKQTIISYYSIPFPNDLSEYIRRDVFKHRI